MQCNSILSLVLSTDAAEVHSSETEPTSIRQSLGALNDNFRDIARHRILSVAGNNYTA